MSMNRAFLRLVSALFLAFVALPVMSVRAARMPPAMQGLVFVENVGQFANSALFQVRSGDSALWLTSDAIWLTVADGASQPLSQAVALKLSFLGANPQPEIEPFGKLNVIVNFYAGGDPAKWYTTVPVWSGVRYRDLYPGLDLEIDGAGGGWRWRLLERGNGNSLAVQGADVAICVEGASDVAIDGGAIVAMTPLGGVRIPLLAGLERQSAKPVVVGANTIVAPFAAAPKERALLAAAAAPGLVYSTFFGGGASDRAYGLAVGQGGSAYVTGYTTSLDLPTTPGAYNPVHNGAYDLFVARLNGDGGALVYATFLGGSRYDYGRSIGGIAVDATGSTYVTGWTDSADFPVTAGAAYTTLAGAYDAFIAKFTGTGSLVYSTFLGGVDADYGRAIAVDESGNAYVAGQTLSPDFPTTMGSHSTTNSGGAEGDAFLAKLNEAGSQLVFASYLGGGGDDWATAVALDYAGSAYLTGQTGSADFPTTEGAYDISINGTVSAFITKFSPAGDSLAYSTFLGGSGADYGRAIAVDTRLNTYISGYTSSSDFPVTDKALATGYNGGLFDAFVVKVDASGGQLVYSTFLGGTADDYGRAIVVDRMGNAYITGNTYSTDFPTTADAYDNSHNGSGDAFVARVNADGTTLTYTSFLGGASDDSAFAIALDIGGRMYLAGETFSADFPTTAGSYDISFNGGNDAFITSIAPGGSIYLPLAWHS
ncbi:MAG: SBBP repeat-containing protein [Anaerolineae bacterium]